MEGGADAVESLVAWTSSRGGGGGLARGACVAGYGVCDRTLATSDEGTFEAGDVVLSLPWPLALTTRTAMKRLMMDERRGESVLGLSVKELMAFCTTQSLVPKPTVEPLIFSLQLLSEASKAPGDSTWSPYLALLPSRPGSAFLAPSVRGPPLIHPLLFRPDDLESLQSPQLREAIREDRARLGAIFDAIFRRRDAALPPRRGGATLDDFLWAQAIVRSRALDLTLQGPSGGEATRCMLPLIDLCNHSHACNCTLRLVLSSPSPSRDGQGERNGTREEREGCESSPARVELVATRAIRGNEALTIDYGYRSIRDFFRVYGFVPQPAEARCEIFEDAQTNPFESVLVKGSRVRARAWGEGGGGKEGDGEGEGEGEGEGRGARDGAASMFSLSRVIVLPSLSYDVLLDGADPVARALGEAALEARFLLDGVEGAVLYELVDQAALGERGWRSAPQLFPADAGTFNRLNEADAIGRVVRFCERTARGMPTTVEEDAAALAEDGGMSLERRMAITYRLARKTLLRQVIDDLGAILAALS